MKNNTPLKRLVELAKRSNDVISFTNEVITYSHWYLTTEFLKMQRKNYFIEFYNQYKRG